MTIVVKNRMGNSEIKNQKTIFNDTYIWIKFIKELLNKPWNSLFKWRFHNIIDELIRNSFQFSLSLISI